MADEKVKKYIAGMIEKARKAQEQINFASQQEVDDICTRVAWAGVRDDFAHKYAEFCANDSAMGYAPDKYKKLQVKIKGVLRDMKGKKSVGVVEENKIKGIKRVAKPVGVVGAIIPVTNSEATPFLKMLMALKTRNAIIMAPHPRTLETNKMAAKQVRETLKRNGWPEDLVQNVDKISIDASKELMAQCDLVLATGGPAMVKAAYSSGTPSQGVGAGNSVSIIDETADLKDAADKIMRSKTFDYATSCSTENAILIHEDVYDKAIEELNATGGYLVPEDEKKKLQKAMWIDGVLNRDIVAQAPEKIARIAGINLPKGKSFFMVPETGIGKDYPFSGEKLSVVCAIYKWKDFNDAIDMVNRITNYSGRGHSCSIHSINDERIEELSFKVNVSRLIVRQPQCLANSGAWTNGMPMTLTLGCGTWGGNASSSNITWEHLLNYTWVSYPIPSTEPTDEELFGAIIMEEAQAN